MYVLIEAQKATGSMMKEFSDIRLKIKGARHFGSGWHLVFLLLLSPFVARVVKGQSLEDRVQKAAGTQAVEITVKDDFHKTPLDSVIVRFINQDNNSIVYVDTTDANGQAGWGEVDTPVDDDDYVPHTFKLKQNYPNPFNPATTIPVSIDRLCDANLSIYNINGQLVKTLYEGNLAEGDHEYRWDGTNNNGMGVAAGLYIALFRTKDRKGTIKMMLLDGNHSVAGFAGGSSHEPLMDPPDEPDSVPKISLAGMDAGQWYDVELDRRNYSSEGFPEFVSDGTGTLYFNYEMTRNNQAPRIISVNATPQEAMVGEDIDFAGVAIDPENDPFDYLWQTDGTYYDGQLARHSYDTPGEKLVTFTVTDERGASSDTTFSVTISDLERIAQGWVTDISNDSLLAGQPVTINGITDTTDANGYFSVAGLDPGNYRIRVGDGEIYLTMERNAEIADSDTTTLPPMRVVENDSALVEFLNGTVFADRISQTQGFYTQKWLEKASGVYRNTEHMTPQTMAWAETFMTDPALASSTYYVHSYTASDFQDVTTAELPPYGEAGTFIWDNLGSPFAAVYENNQNRGIIDATVLSIPDGAGLSGTYHEGLTGITGIDEIIQSLNNKYVTARNDPPTHGQISELDEVANKFSQDRDPNTLPGDIGPVGTSMAKSAVPGAPIIVRDGQVIGDNDLTPGQISAYHTLLEKSVRPPSYVVFF